MTTEYGIDIYVYGPDIDQTYSEVGPHNGPWSIWSGLDRVAERAKDHLGYRSALEVQTAINQYALGGVLSYSEEEADAEARHVLHERVRTLEAELGDARAQNIILESLVAAGKQQGELLQQEAADAKAQVQQLMRDYDELVDAYDLVAVDRDDVIQERNGLAGELAGTIRELVGVEQERDLALFKLDRVGGVLDD